MPLTCPDLGNVRCHVSHHVFPAWALDFVTETKCGFMGNTQDAEAMALNLDPNRSRSVFSSSQGQILCTDGGQDHFFVTYHLTQRVSGEHSAPGMPGRTGEVLGNVSQSLQGEIALICSSGQFLWCK